MERPALQCHEPLVHELRPAVDEDRLLGADGERALGDASDVVLVVLAEIGGERVRDRALLADPRHGDGRVEPAREGDADALADRELGEDAMHRRIVGTVPPGPCRRHGRSVTGASAAAHAAERAGGSPATSRYGWTMRLQLVTGEGVPDFLDLPWDVPLEEWESERLVDVVRGISRHVVRFVRYDDAIFALKEINPRLARKEFALLRNLAERTVPVVEATGIVDGRGAELQLDAVLVTRHLDFSLPYRTLFRSSGDPHLREHLLDALAQLLVRAHLAGFFWGDCSLSNTLFRRDAGALSAYLVDAETGELHPTLTEGQRLHDLLVARENLAGELFDLAAAGELPPEIDPVDIGEAVLSRYHGLWDELTREELIRPDERHRIQERLERLHELGFDTEELELVADGDAFRLRREPSRGRVRLPPAPAPHAHGARRPGEPGAPAARRPAQLPRGGRADGGRPPARSRRLLPLARGGLRAGARGDPDRPARQARGAGALPPAARASLVPLGGARPVRHDERGDRLLQRARSADGRERAGRPGRG